MDCPVLLLYSTIDTRRLIKEGPNRSVEYMFDGCEKLMKVK